MKMLGTTLVPRKLQRTKLGLHAKNNYNDFSTKKEYEMECMDNQLKK